MKTKKAIIGPVFLVIAVSLFLTKTTHAHDQGKALNESVTYSIGKAVGGPNIITYVGEETAFNGIAFDPEGTISRYEWDFDGDGTVDWQSNTTGEATHTFTKAGQYEATFKAYDGFEQELLSTVRVVVREGKGKVAFIPKRHLHRSNRDKIEKEKVLLKEQLNISPKEEEFLELQTNAPSSQGETSPIRTSGMESASPAADGVNNRYVLMINGGAEDEFWEDVQDTYDMFLGYGITDENIYLLNYKGAAPDGTNPNNMIDYPATKPNLRMVCDQLAALVDADDLLFVWATDHGNGYVGPVQRVKSEELLFGYLGSEATVDPGDEQDYLESEFKLRGLFTGGYYHKGNHGMELWRVYCNNFYCNNCIGGYYYYRHKYASHFQDVNFIEQGLRSDNDIYIEEFVDYLEGDLNKNGIIEPGEVVDFNANGIPPYDPATDTYDEGDWGKIDKFIDNVRTIATQVPTPEGAKHPYCILDYNLDNHLDIDLDHDPLHPEVNGTDLDNNGLFDGVDINDDKDMDDMISIDEELCLYGDQLTDDELRVYLAPIHAKVVIVAMESCFSGGFIEDLSLGNRIIMTATEEETVAWSGPNSFFRNILSGLSYPDSARDPSPADSNNDGCIDMAEVFNFAAANGYGDATEIAQYDDNGDGIPHAHYIPAGGDGPLGLGVTLYFWNGSSTNSTADTTPPVVQINSPFPNALISCLIPVLAQASDNRDVIRVDFFVDGEVLGVDATSPYEWQLDTTTLSDGPHTLFAKAYDAAGNMGTSAGVPITVDNTAPVVNDMWVASDAITFGRITKAVPGSQVWLCEKATDNGTEEMQLTAWTEITMPDSSARTLYLTYGMMQKMYFQGFTLTQPGAYSIVFCAQDPAGNTTRSTPVPFLAAGPVGSVLINSGADSTASAVVTLTLAATTEAEGGITQMRFSNDWITWSEWETYSTSKAWTLSAGEGVKGVAAQFKDAAGDMSVICEDTILLTANHAPVAQDQNTTTAEDTAKSITLAATDVDNDALTYAIVTPPSHGTLSGTAPNVTYMPAANYNGSDSFTFKANDGKADSLTATVSITVTPVNDPPVAQNQNVTTAEDTAKAITLAATDVDNDALTYAIVAPPSHGTLSGTAPNVTYTPAANYNGSDSFTFKANDGKADSSAATVSITVTPVNDPPAVAITSPSQGASFTAPANVTITADASDIDGTITKVEFYQGAVKLGECAASPYSFTWSGVAAGAWSLTTKATDNSGAATVSAAVNITVTASANQPPTVATAAAASPNPVTAKTCNLSVLGADDKGAAALVYTWATTGTPPAPVSFNVNGNNMAKNTTATFTKAGNYTFRVTIRDGDGLSVTSSVAVSVMQTVSAITVSPTSAVVAKKGKQQFTGAVLDQFSATMNVPLKWTVSGGGTISATGLFTAGNIAGGPYQVKAAWAGKSGTASVTVVK